MNKLEQIIKQFVDDQRIYSPDTIYQTDRVIENAYEFIEDLITEVGYWYTVEDISEDWLEQLEWQKHQEESYAG